VAADRRLPLALVAGVAATCGLLNGWFDGGGLAGAGSSGLAAVGIACAVFVIVALMAGQAAALNKKWTRTVVRVAGSWIGAIGLLMFGWAVR
jgi:urease accessory protein